MYRLMSLALFLLLGIASVMLVAEPMFAPVDCGAQQCAASREPEKQSCCGGSGDSNFPIKCCCGPNCSCLSQPGEDTPVPAPTLPTVRHRIECGSTHSLSTVCVIVEQTVALTPQWDSLHTYPNLSAAQHCIALGKMQL